MQKILLLIVLFATGCFQTVRNTSVYKSELSFIRELNKQEVKYLKFFVSQHCDCDNLNNECKKSVNTLLVADKRLDWHLDMMAHAGGVGPEVGEAPILPSEVDYCKGL